MNDIIPSVLITTGIVGIACCIYMLGYKVGQLRTEQALVKNHEDEAVMLRGGFAHIVSLERYRELRCRESQYFRYQRRYERQNEHLDD